MTPDVVRIGNAQGFWGDSPDAPLRLVQQQSQLDYLTLDYLSEVSMSILAIQREKDPTLGYARDFLDVVRSLIPQWQAGLKVKVVANAGGLNPQGCAKACIELLRKAQCKHIKVGVVFGDDILNKLKEESDNSLFFNLESQHPLSSIQNLLETGNAYLGAKPITDLINSGADVIITGRIADPSLTVGPCVAHFGWNWDEYNRIAGATIAGHLIECGTQVTGGISTNWLHIPDPAHIGFPIAEVRNDGSCIITKPPGTGGKITIETVKEQLLYEIGDPACYLSPDTTVSFLGLKLQTVEQSNGESAVYISGAIGSPPPSTYKVSATYRSGYKAEGMLAIFGDDAPKKAKLCGEIVLERVRNAGYVLQHTKVECLGAGDIVPIFHEKNRIFNQTECVLRVSVADSRKEAVERFTKEIAPLVTSGPQGVTGYTSGRPKVRPVFGYWPCLIERKDVTTQIKIYTVE